MVNCCFRVLNEDTKKQQLNLLTVSINIRNSAELSLRQDILPLIIILDIGNVLWYVCRLLHPAGSSNDSDKLQYPKILK